MRDIATRAAAVVDHDVLADVLLQLLGNDASCRVSSTAGGEADDHRDGLFRQLLGLYRRQASQQRKAGGQLDEFVLVHCVSINHCIGKAVQLRTDDE